MKIGSAVPIFIGKSGMESSKICNAVDVFPEKSATQTKENLGLRQHDLGLDGGAALFHMVVTLGFTVYMT